MEEYRLRELSLPDDIVAIARRLGRPSQQDLQRVTTVLSDYSDRLESVRKLIRLEGVTGHDPNSPMLKTLHGVETIARYRVTACSNICSTWHILPFELWDQIFWFYLDAIRNGPSTIGVEPGTIAKLASQAPLTLSRVSRAWQAAVQSSPSVWSDLTIPIDIDMDTEMPFIEAQDVFHIIPRLNRFVGGRKPWSLTLLDTGNTDTDSAPGASRSAASLPLLPLLQHHPSLLLVERLCIIGPTPSTVLSGLGFPATTSLEVLPSRRQSRRLLHGVFPSLPNLSGAILVDIMDKGPFQRDIPYARLTHLFLGGDVNVQEMEGILRLCTSLRQACFSLGYSDHRMHSPWIYDRANSHADLTHSLDHLTDLTILRPRGSKLGKDMRFQNFAFPKLTSMHLYLGFDLSLPTARFVIYESLTSLTLIGPRLCGPQIIEGILSACPLLVELVAPVVADYKQVLQPLTYDKTNPKAPHLEYLTVVVADMNFIAWNENPMGYTEIRQVPKPPSDFPRAALTDMVASRRALNSDIHATQQPVRLKRLALRFLQPSFYHYGIGILGRIAGMLHQEMAPFVVDGLELSVGIYEGRGYDYCPLRAEGSLRHWDRRSMGFLELDREAHIFTPRR